MRRSWQPGSWLLIAGLLTLGSACAPGSRPADGPSPVNHAVRVNIDNVSGFPVEIYAVGGGTSYRMGTVYPGLATVFELRQMMGNVPVEFVARRAPGDPLIRSGIMLVSAGDVVDFRVENNVPNSWAAIRPR